MRQKVGNIPDPKGGKEGPEKGANCPARIQRWRPIKTRPAETLQGNLKAERRENDETSPENRNESKARIDVSSNIGKEKMLKRGGGGRN